jgi:hypothetical protein
MEILCFFRFIIDILIHKALDLPENCVYMKVVFLLQIK